MKNKFDIVCKGYNKIAGRYTKEREKIDNSAEINEFCATLNHGAKILDVGCGTGVPIAKYLIDKNFDVTGIDLSPEMVSVARQNVPDATFLQMNMTEINFPKESFDGLISCYAVFHVPRGKHADLFKSFYKVLKPQSWMLLSVGNTEWEEVADYFDTKMFWSHFHPDKSKLLVTEAGFNIIFGRTVDSGNERHYWILAQKH